MVIDRTGAQALMPEDVSREIVEGLAEESTVMQLARRAPNMSRAQQRIPVLATLPVASFVNGDTGFKAVTEASWENKYLDAEELAVIVPIPENVLEDADYDLWAEIRPKISEAFGAAFDAAVYYGTNAPASWPDDLLTQVVASGNDVTFGTGGDAYDDIMGIEGVIAQVEEDGFMVNGHAAAMQLRARLRALRDTNTGVPIFNRSVQEGTRYELDGEPILFPRNGALDPAETLLISGDWNQLIYAIRTDMTYKLLTEATIYEADGTTVKFALAQQDMVALRVKMRLAWQVPNPVSAFNIDNATRFPFAALTPAAVG